MANLIAQLVWCDRRGSEMILGDRSHMFLWEQANGAQFGGVGYRPLPNLDDGTIPLDALKKAVRAANIHNPVTRLIALENTHNQCGGRLLTAGYTAAVGDFAAAAGLRLHIDGARLWNAAAALDVPPADLVRAADSVSVCFSKGLGAPAGSAVCGSADFVARARRVRKALGGGMRQAGVLAAAAQVYIIYMFVVYTMHQCCYHWYWY
jgi:threonine aldolase